VDAMRVLGGRARGVVVIDTATSDEALRNMHDAGIRGVRVNLETSGQTNPAAALEQLRWAATRVAPFGWHVQTFTNLGLLAPLHDTILALPTPLVIDHFGRPRASQGVGQPGFDRLLSLMGSGRVYLKLSAPHRISQQPDYRDVPPIAQALIAENPDRLIWATDWPHPGARPGVPRSIGEIEPFRNEDDGAALNRLAGWVGDSGVLRRILADNPARLYDFPH